MKKAFEQIAKEDGRYNARAFGFVLDGLGYTAKKVAKVVAIAATTALVSAALTPAAGVVAQEVMTGGAISGDVAAQAGEAAIQGVQNLADPANLGKKVVKKAATKAAKMPISKDG